MLRKIAFVCFKASKYEFNFTDLGRSEMIIKITLKLDARVL